MSKIENNMSNTPNLYSFKGVEYDMQLTMYVISQFEDFNDVLNSMGKVETIFKMATAMMNGHIVKNELNIPLLNADFVMANTTMADLPELTEIIAKAMGIKPMSEAEKELDAIAEKEGAKDIKN